MGTWHCHIARPALDMIAVKIGWTEALGSKKNILEFKKNECRNPKSCRLLGKPKTPLLMTNGLTTTKEVRDPFWKKPSEFGVVMNGSCTKTLNSRIIQTLGKTENSVSQEQQEGILEVGRHHPRIEDQVSLPKEWKGFVNSWARWTETERGPVARHMSLSTLKKSRCELKFANWKWQRRKSWVDTVSWP